MIFGRLRAAILKDNETMCSFGLKDIPHLGYVIPREGIKPDPMKVQGIIDIGRLADTNKIQALIGMVHYYRYMWPRRSHILAPLPEAASGPIDRKIFWNDALESSFK